MSTMTLLGRIGRDAELRSTPNGDSVINLAVAYNYGRKGQDGRKPSQWIDATLWGKRAEAMAPYLVKGQQVYLVLTDVHVRTFDKSDGTQGAVLTGTVQCVEFAGGAPQQQQQQQPPRQQQQRQAPRQQAAPAGDDFEDDSIPF